MSSQPHQDRLPQPYHLAPAEQTGLDEQFQKMLSLRAIERAPQEPGMEYLSQHFVIPKSDGRWRAVFNLKALNQHVWTEHFKMESLHHAADLLQQGYFMCKLDLKDAFHSVRIHPYSRRWLRFRWREETWQYRCLPFGLSDAPRTFTKILAPVAAFLRSLGILLVVYLDDWLFIAATAEAAKQSVNAAAFLLEHLGFIISRDKSILTPVQSLEFLGITVNSLSMEFHLPDRKYEGIRKDCRQMLNKGTASLSALRHLLGKMQDATKAVPLAQARSRMLQFVQNQITDEQEIIALLDDAQDDLSWWIHLTPAQRCRPVQIAPPSLTLTTDASNHGWGATCNGQVTGGPWTIHDDRHINWKELKAVFLGLKTLCPDLTDLTLRLEIDNTTAVAYINRQGGTHSFLVCQLAREIWDWAYARRLFLVAVHVPGASNTTADYLSRHLLVDSSDWKLDSDLFHLIVTHEGLLLCDLFASRHNSQLPQYVSWYPDPDAVAVDALSLPSHMWEDGYLFPPIALVSRCLQFIQYHQIANAVLVAPAWKGQAYYPQLLSMLRSHPWRLPEIQDPVLGPFGESHPMEANRLQLAVWPLSGRPHEVAAFQHTLPVYGFHRGAHQPSPATSRPGTSGFAGVRGNRLIPWKLMKCG
ncbi:uncharacterized protein LOC135816551 [Sycon ciliatum]|uniref:uncharacterized protein LOC135816551 n=1 Tax=Sycon ciliatum TaxID=27933 RepID=UPI0031F69968